MKRHINFGSTDQLRHVANDVNFLTKWTGEFNDQKEPILDESIKLPTIEVEGTEKIHGINAGVNYNTTLGFWVQSRRTIVDNPIHNPNYSGLDDFKGIALHAFQNKGAWESLIKDLADIYAIDLSKYVITVYYEFAGGSIQRNSCVSGLTKRSIIFKHFKVSSLVPSYDANGEETGFRWLTTGGIDRKANNIFNITNYPKITAIIDFNDLDKSTEVLNQFVSKLEKNSLVGEAMGAKGNIGEGYVFTFTYKDRLHKFKVVGNAHAKSKSKVKTLSPVDQELEQKKIDFVNNVACKEWRLDQMYNELPVKDRSTTGDYLRAVINDVIKEESDIMQEQGLEPKSVNSMISKVAREYFFSRLDNDT